MRENRLHAPHSLDTSYSTRTYYSGTDQELVSRIEAAPTSHTMSSWCTGACGGRIEI